LVSLVNLTPLGVLPKNLGISMPSSSIVHTKSQGRGIGKSLVEYVKNKYENIELAVYKDNKKAVEFYKKQGFKIIKEQENEDSGHLEYLMSYSKNSSKNQ
ncbi:GNAT family N-acetyltransferase, partial [Clostridium perfringens]